MPKITTNYIYNVALTLSTFIINLFLFPYVSRVLGVDYVGRIGFVSNVVNYFSLFVLLGIRTVGIREIAACGDDKEKRSKVFSNLTAFIILSNLVVASIYFVSIFTVERFQQEIPLFVIGGINLLFNSFLIEWFYQGLENFKYITVRNVIIKVLYAITVLLLIKEKEDFLLYSALTTAVIVINAVINIAYSRKFVRFSYKNIKLREFFKPIVSLGIYNIMVSMYTTFNVIYLGFVCTDSEVGYYYTATKIYYIIIGFFFAFTNVMLPRMSSLLSQNKKKEFDNRLKDSFEIIISVAIPIVVFFELMTPEAIRIITGTGFEGAILPMRIIMPELLITSCAQVWVIQLLMPLKKDTVILVGSILGAIVGVLLNIIIVKDYGAVGSAVVMLLSELVGGLISLVYSLKKQLFVLPIKMLLTNIAVCLPIGLLCLFIKQIISNNNLCFLIVALLYVLYYCSYFILNKRSIVGQNIKKNFYRKK